MEQVKAKRAKRFNYNAFISIEGAHHKDIIFDCLNISKTGAHLVSSLSLNVGSTLKIGILDPSTKEIVPLISTVKWIKYDDEISGKYGLGIEFTFDNNENQRKIKNIIYYIEKIINENREYK